MKTIVPVFDENNFVGSTEFVNNLGESNNIKYGLKQLKDSKKYVYIVLNDSSGFSRGDIVSPLIALGKIVNDFNIETLINFPELKKLYLETFLE